MRALLLAVLLAVGCTKSPVSVDKTNNPEVPVELLFEHEGCRVFRFYDTGRPHYFASCLGGTITHQPTGNKNAPTYIQEIPTAVSP